MAIATFPHGALRLTPREYDVLGELGRGARNYEIAASLGIGAGTVEFHLTRVYKKLEVRSRLEAVLRAAELGLISPNRVDYATTQRR